MHLVHDGYFKEVMQTGSIAGDFMRQHLPAKLLALVDLATLRLAPNSFIDPQYRAHSSDLVYEVTVADRSADRVAYIYVLVGHQSSPYRIIAFRKMRYAIC